jgi:hypothetical protein
MNERKIAVATAGLGAVLVCASGVYFGTGASALLASSPGPVLYAEEAPVVSAPVDSASTPVPAAGAEQSASPEPVAEPVAEPMPGAAPSFDEQLASIPSDWPQSEIENARIWLEQARIITDCMADEGFEYTYEPFWLATPGRAEAWPQNDPDVDQDAASLALWGDTDVAADYRWEDAGCHGYAVHVTGMDNAH